MEQIVKKEKNIVEVRTVIFDKVAATINEGIISKTDLYGKERLNSELQTALANLDYWTNLDEKTYKTEQKAKAQAVIDRLNLIKTEMDKK